MEDQEHLQNIILIKYYRLKVTGDKNEARWGNIIEGSNKKREAYEQCPE